MTEAKEKNWELLTLKNIVSNISTNDKKIKQKEYEANAELPVIDQGEDLIGGYTNNVCSKVECDLPAIIFGDHTKAVKYVNFDFAPGADGIKVLEPKENVNPKFLYYLLKRMVFEIPDKGYARHFQYLNKEKYPVPPLPTQHRIVEKIEELFSELDNGVENLKKAQQQLKTYRQAVLKDALKGDWDIVKVERVCNRVKVGVVIKPKQYYTGKSEGIPAFRSANVREFRVEDSNWVYFNKEGHDVNKRTQLNEGDVLLVRSGYPGTSCVVPKKYEGTNAIDIVIAEPNRDVILPDYLCVFNNSPMGKGLFLSGSRGVAQKHLNVGVYKKLELPLPPLYEQERIVSEVEESLSIIEKLEHTIKENLQKAEALRKSILKKAFGGELVE